MERVMEGREKSWREEGCGGDREEGHGREFTLKTIEEKDLPSSIFMNEFQDVTWESRLSSPPRDRVCLFIDT